MSGGLDFNQGMVCFDKSHTVRFAAGSKLNLGSLPVSTHDGWPLGRRLPFGCTKYMRFGGG